LLKKPFPIFVLSQRLIARNVRELFSLNRGVSHLNEARCIDDVSRGSLSCYEILTNNYRSVYRSCYLKVVFCVVFHTTATAMTMASAGTIQREHTPDGAI
jgi:hypothetical protein